MRKLIHGFPFLSYMSMGLSGAPLLKASLGTRIPFFNYINFRSGKLLACLLTINRGLHFNPVN